MQADNNMEEEKQQSVCHSNSLKAMETACSRGMLSVWSALQWSCLIAWTTGLTVLPTVFGLGLV